LKFPKENHPFRPAGMAGAIEKEKLIVLTPVKAFK
jgi:hypothetical protein